MDARKHYRGRQTGAKQEAKRLKWENKWIISHKITCHYQKQMFAKPIEKLNVACLLFELKEEHGFFPFICQCSCSVCIGELCADFKRYHLFPVAVILAFLFALFSWYLRRSIRKNNFNWSSSFLYRTQDKHQTINLSSQISLLMKASTWT